MIELKECLIKNSCKILSNKQNAKNTKCIQGVKNFHYIQKDDQSKKGGYKAVDNSYYFFPWNKDSMKLYEKINPIWGNVKILSGVKKNEFMKNKPLDGIINRIHIIQYLKGGGMISPHSDPYIYSKIQIGCILSERGKDYFSGGFIVFNKRKKEILLDKEIGKGDLICFFPSLIHGVKPIDKKKSSKIDHSSLQGRWFMSLTTVGSEHLKGREKAKSVNLQI